MEISKISRKKRKLIKPNKCQNPVERGVHAWGVLITTIGGGRRAGGLKLNLQSGFFGHENGVRAQWNNGIVMFSKFTKKYNLIRDFQEL